jgi:molecular chaperone DnaK (HSP70)
MKVGIDFGTSYSLVARCGADGAPVLIPDHHETDTFHTPSSVHIADHGIFVGGPAELLVEQDPNLKVLRWFKRDLSSRQALYYGADGASWFAEGLTALVLKKLKLDAESNLAQDLTEAVLTVPAHFTDLQRRSLLAAAQLADIPVVGLLEEPVAAALHYGVGCPDDVPYLVYDWGGGTFDVSIVVKSQDTLRVLAKSGVSDLGGKNVDDAISAELVTAYESLFGSFRPTARHLLELARIGEDLKIDLSSPCRPAARRVVWVGGRALELAWDRRTLDSMTAPLVARTREVMLACIAEAGLSTADMAMVLLVGGTSMLPLVRQAIAQDFTRDGQRIEFHEPSRAVAYGAAVYAASIGDDGRDVTTSSAVIGVTGHNVGIRVMDADRRGTSVDVVLKRNLPLPARARRTYFASRPGQTQILLEVVQFTTPEDVCVLGTLIIGPFPPADRDYPVDVTLLADEDAKIHVQAYDTNSGVELRQSFSRDDGASPAQIGAQRALVRSAVINSI